MVAAAYFQETRAGTKRSANDVAASEKASRAAAGHRRARPFAAALGEPDARQGNRPGRGGPRRPGLALDARGPQDRSGRRGGIPEAVRWNLGAWLGQVHKPLRIIDTAVRATHLAFSPDGRSFATGTVPHIVRTRHQSTSGTPPRGESSPRSPVRSPRSPSDRTAKSSSPPRTTGARAGHRPRHGAGALDDPGTYPESRARCDSTSVPTVPRSLRTAIARSAVIEAWRLMRLDAVTGQQRGEPMRGGDGCAVAPDGGTVATDRLENGEAYIDVLELPSGRRKASWRAGGKDRWLTSLAPMGGRCSCHSQRRGRWLQ